MNQIEHEIFKTCEKPLGYSILSRDQWKTVHLLANDCNIAIKKSEKRSCVVL